MTVPQLVTPVCIPIGLSLFMLVSFLPTRIPELFYGKKFLLIPQGLAQKLPNVDFPTHQHTPSHTGPSILCPLPVWYLGTWTMQFTIQPATLLRIKQVNC